MTRSHQRKIGLGMRRAWANKSAAGKAAWCSNISKGLKRAWRKRR